MGRDGKSPYPFRWRPATEEEKAERLALYRSPMTSAVDVVFSEPAGLVFPKGMAQLAEAIYNMELREDDVWVVTYPKCGTTWAQEMIWQILHNFDLEGGKVNLEDRFPFLEVPMFFMGQENKELPPGMAGLEGIEEMLARAAATFQQVQTMPSPRCIKTHLPVPMLPPRLLDTCKVVFVCRDPRDCCASYYNHETMIPFHGFTGDFASFAEYFREGKLIFGNYWYHLEHCWNNRHHPNALLLWFEDMKKDLTLAIRRTARLLGRHLTELKVLQLDDHLYFGNMKKNPAVNYEYMAAAAGTGQAFMNKGKVGNWRSKFTKEEALRWADWIRQSKAYHGIDHAFQV